MAIAPPLCETRTQTTHHACADRRPCGVRARKPTHLSRAVAYEERPRCGKHGVVRDLVFVPVKQHGATVLASDARETSQAQKKARFLAPATPRWR